jgi:hypothetical protein
LNFFSLSQTEVDTTGGQAGVAELVVSEIVDEPLNVGREGGKILK